jgi:hypothetical protein
MELKTSETGRLPILSHVNVAGLGGVRGDWMWENNSITTVCS